MRNDNQILLRERQQRKKNFEQIIIDNNKMIKLEEKTVEGISMFYSRILQLITAYDYCHSFGKSLLFIIFVWQTRSGFNRFWFCAYEMECDFLVCSCLLSTQIPTEYSRYSFRFRIIMLLIAWLPRECITTFDSILFSVYRTPNSMCMRRRCLNPDVLFIVFMLCTRCHANRIFHHT